MSFKTITAMVLLSCLGATGASMGLTEEPPQEERAITLPPPLTIATVRWIMTATSTTVQICTSEPLPVGEPTLMFDDGSSSIFNGAGVIDADLNCAIFSTDGKYSFSGNPSRYELIVAEASNPSAFLGRGVTRFAITVKTTLLTCGGSHITKLTWNEDEKLPEDFNCLDGVLLDKVCYHDGDITETEFCFGVLDGENNVNVCLNGPIDITASSDGTAVSANYFYYGPEAVSNEPADAILSLVVEPGGFAQLRAIVRLAVDPESPEETREATIHECFPTECTFTKYERKFATYEVCVEAMDDKYTTLKTATTTFTDMNLYVFDGGSQKSMLLEFVFANGLDDMKYQASLSQNQPVDGDLGTVGIDCTSVTAGHACFGTLDTGEGAETVYLALSSMDGSNIIIAPFGIPATPPLRRE